MSEKEKMLAGLPYNTRDPEIMRMYLKARNLIQQYNSCKPNEVDLKESVLNQLLNLKGNGVWIEAPFFCDYGENISIGANSFINFNCVFLDGNKINIGKNALIGPYVQIYTVGHPLIASERIIQENEKNIHYFTTTKPVDIGENVWIGGNTIIMPGVSIGNDVTIGAGSVVTKDVPDHVLAAGNPCKIIKNI